MGSREEILAALRAAAPHATPLPELAQKFVQFPDLRERFSQSVVEVGGRCLRIEAMASLEAELLKIPEYASGKKIASLVPGVQRGSFDLAAVSDPHALEDVDFCVLQGELGVAENGAVWVTNHGGKNRAVAFLAQHLAIVVLAATLVPNLHEAYERLSLPSPGFGLFLAGPSKTADIEQALVIGAHGARSCTVILVG